MPTERPRVMVVIDEDMLKEIDDIRFDKRYASRSQLMFDLLKMGIKEMREKESSQNDHPKKE